MTVFKKAAGFKGLKMTAAALVLAAPGLAYAVSASASEDGHDGHMELTGVYKDRHEVMEGFGGFAKSTGAMVKGGAEFDLAKIKEGASAVADHAGPALLELFPEGTNDAPSEALDKIWEDWDGFTAAANLLQTRASALAEAEDQASAAAAFGGMLQACGGCHKAYRQEK